MEIFCTLYFKHVAFKMNKSDLENLQSFISGAWLIFSNVAKENGKSPKSVN